MAEWLAYAPRLLAALISFILAGLLLSLDFRGRAIRAFALFLVIRAFALATYGFGLVAGTGADADVWWRVYPYFVIALAFAPLQLAAACAPRRTSRMGRGAFTAGLLVLALAAEALYVADHTLFWDLDLRTGDPRGPALDAPAGPLFVFDALFEVSYAAVALLVAREFTRSPPGPARSSALLVSLAFAVVVAFDVVYLFAFFGPYVFRHDAPLAGGFVAVLVLAFGMVAATAAGLRRHASGSPDADVRRQVRWYLGALCFAVASALFAAFSRPSLAPTLAITQAFTGLWRLALPLVVTYALVRHQLFGIDLKVKWTLRQSTVAAFFVTAFFVVSEAATEFFSGRVGTYLGIAAAGALIFMLAPLQRFGDRLADHAMPDVSASPDYLAYRRLLAYRAAFESVWQDGVVTRKERATLERLRHELGIRTEDARRIEQEIGGAGTYPRA